MTDSSANTTVWDTKTQQFHGGQDWKFLHNFVEDFSVTTNWLGTPVKALKAARDAIDTCHHYPPADQEPAKSSLAAWIWPEQWKANKDRLLLGNGASELIDLVIRSAPTGSWKAGPWDVQYKEYQRSAETNGRNVLSPKSDDKADAWILNHVQDNGVVVIDESMQIWVGPDFRQDSMTAQAEFMEKTFRERNISIYVIHSWTKIWSCTGLRLGSIVCPTVTHCTKLKRIQVPWSVNSPALAFLDEVVRDTEYLEETWKLTSIYRAQLIERLQSLANGRPWEFFGKPYLSWVWIDLKDTETAEKAIAWAKEAGVPIRSGEPGYHRPTFVRIAVREPKKTDVLLAAWKNL
ncbi:hypothetical protein BGZ65_008249 [Modicella reniformis]|uniref:Aminotransferase class I/classII large domain-containing protein n=1 Tax=Modicella reniformis TaxID=1440133 RepID=A0A9P6M845_9FUNG|nr:hypothetical protein BGZ65_008249 [Modicella reniformis]